MDKYVKSASFDMVHLCVHKYDDYHMSGVAYNNTIDHPIEFQDIQKLFLELDDIFDRNGNPLSSHVKRSFKKEEVPQTIYKNKPKILNEYTDFFDKKGKLGAVDFVVKTRLSSNWQGIVFYGDKQEEFVGMLDLINKVIKFLDL